MDMNKKNTTKPREYTEYEKQQFYEYGYVKYPVKK